MESSTGIAATEMRSGHRRITPVPAPLVALGCLTFASFPLDNLPFLERSVPFLLSLLLIGAVGLYAVLHPSTIRTAVDPRLALTTSLFVLLAGISTFWSINAQVTFNGLLVMLFMLATATALALACRGHLRAAFCGFVVVTTVVSLLARTDSAGVRVTEVSTQSTREAAFGNLNDTALMLAMGTLIGAMLLVTAYTPKARMLSAVGTVISFVGVVQTGSRGVMMAVVAGLLVFTITSALQRRLSARNALLTLGGFGAAFTWIYLQLTDPGRTLRIFQIYDKAGEVNTTGRSDIWEAATSIDPGPFGLGFATGDYLMTYFYGAPIALHSVYLSLFMEFGLLGCVVAALFFGSVLAVGLRPRDTRALLLGVWTLIGIAAALYPIELRRGLWLVIALSFMVIIDSRLARDRALLRGRR